MSDNVQTARIDSPKISDIVIHDKGAILQALPRAIVAHAEAQAASGNKLNSVLSTLRQLSLDDYGMLLISMPNADFPCLSGLLPAMASAEVQTGWTGSFGKTLLKQTVTFVRQVENLFARYGECRLSGAKILDFGCGYGRLLRMFGYYTDPENVWGVDAWDVSIEECRKVGMWGNIRKSDVRPNILPVDETLFDLAVSFSVFTHLAPDTARAALSAIRKSMRAGGLLVATTRPIEFWQFEHKAVKSGMSEQLANDHRQHGFAYLPAAGVAGENYGDFSSDLTFFAVDGWQVLGYDSTVFDEAQVSAILKAS